MEINITRPPKDIKFFDPIEIPLLNSFILVSSGFTLSHYYLIINNLKLRKSYLSLTILLGIYFTILQTIEYSNSFFCFNDRIYGSIFFIIFIYSISRNFSIIVPLIYRNKNHQR